MECPYCKNEMKKGSIHCHNGWLPLVWRSQEDDSSRKIQPWYMNFTKTKLMDVYLCPGCDILIRKIITNK